MSLDEKVHLVEAHGGRYGHRRCLEAVRLPASTWYYRQKRKKGAVDDILDRFRGGLDLVNGRDSTA